jgi:cyclopropane-fatty-acyl-phospholipid synthase
MLNPESISYEADAEQQRISYPPPPILREIAARAGIQFNGSNAWDIQVYDPAVYKRILTQGSFGFGEAYMDGLWDAESLDALVARILQFDLDEKLTSWVKLRLRGEAVRQTLFNSQSTSRAYQVGEQHYDIGNDVFAAMLDKSMSYSCGYWKNAHNLEQAQHDKLDLICRKLELKPGEHLLEIGCGWGGLAQHAAENYGVTVTGITISLEQLQLARERCAGLPVKIELMDYRDLRGQYDKLVSVGMFEHVGPKNYRTFFDIASRLMNDDGLFLLHTIGIYAASRTIDPWLDKYIFPNGKLPAAREISGAIDSRFIIEDWHSFGQDYDHTLLAWWQNFDRAWPQLAEKYGQRFYRMWKYYLMCCAGFFRSRQGQLWQLVLSKRGRQARYYSIRD